MVLPIHKTTYMQFEAKMITVAQTYSQRIQYYGTTWSLFRYVKGIKQMSNEIIQKKNYIQMVLHINGHWFDIKHTSRVKQ